MEQIVQPPDWKLWVILYFFLGGIAAGAYFVATLHELLARRGGDDESGRDISRAGYLIAFPLVAVCGVLLIVDLGRPDRFWHMLIDDYNGHPSIRWGSPMSVGSWALLLFSAFAFLSFVGTLTEMGVIRLGPAQRLDRWMRRGPLHIPFLLLGTIFGFVLGGYTGMLLSASNQPIWSDTHLLGALFLASAASTGMAALALALTLRRRTGHETLAQLERADSFAMVLELLILGAFLITVGTVARPLYSGKYAPWLFAGVVGAGLLAPLALRLRPRLLGSFGPALGALLVLGGGLVLRAVIVLAPQV